MPKSKVVKTTSYKKSSSSRKATTGGASTKNYAIKYRNLDYKYRLVDLEETYSDASIQHMISTATPAVQNVNGGVIFQAVLKSMCYFIPLTTVNGICRNMNVNIKCKYPFAYCVYQNTPDFYKYVFDYCVGRQLKQGNATFDWFYVGNAGQKKDSIIFMPMCRAAGEDLTYLGSSKWQEGTNILFSQLCQKQSTYKEVYSATNSGLYTASVNVYYKKASQFLSGPQSSQFFQGYDDVGKQYDNLASMYSKANVTNMGLNTSTQVQQMFKPGDMTLCILPMWFFYNDMMDSSKLPPTNLSIYPFSFDIKRRIYRLNQDNGLSEAAEKVINNKVTTITNTVVQQARMPAAGTQGNMYPVNLNIVRQVQMGTLGRKIVRQDLDQIGESSNCVIVDANCYDPNTETLQMQAYMDLQPNAPTAGTSILNNYESEDTMNCNVITQAANVDFEQTNQVVQLPFSVSGAFGATDSKTIQQTNTGPYLLKVTGNDFKYAIYPVSDQKCNFAYNYPYYLQVAAAKQAQQPFVVTSQNYSEAGVTVMPGNIYGLGPFTSLDVIEDNIETMINSLEGLNIHVRFTLHYGTYDSNNKRARFDLTDQQTNQEYGYEPTGQADAIYFDMHVFLCLENAQPTQQYLRFAPGSMHPVFDGTSEQYTAHQGNPVFQFSMITALQFLNLLTSPMIYGYDQTGALNGQSYYYLTFADLLTQTDSDIINPNVYISQYVMINPDTQQPDTGSLVSKRYASQYFNQWLDLYQRCYPVQANGEGWKRFKGFLGKAWKFIKNAIPFAKKITHAITPYIPAPYGTVVAGVADKVSDVVTNLDTLAFKKTSSSIAAAVMDDDVDDVFEVTPQYRLSESDEPVDIGATGDDWIDGEGYEQPVNSSGVQINKGIRFDLTRHPVYGELIRQKALGLVPVETTNRLYMQQRLRVKFIKRCSQQIAQAYKAVLTLGNDTNYFTPDDYQEQQ